MTKTTVSTAGEAMPKIDRAALMRRAWEIFRKTYCYPQIKFSDIGRKCFAWALRQAWIEAKAAARIAALSPVVKAERIETLQTLIAHASFIESGPQWKATHPRAPRRNPPTAISLKERQPMTDLIDQAQDMVAEKLERIEAIGSMRRLIFTLPICDSGVAAYRTVSVKVTVPVEALADIAQLVATDIHGCRPKATASAIRLAN